MVRDAIIFATKKHEGQFRKMTNIPYIVHPMEVMHILMQNGCSTETVIGGILHDVLEDTKTDYEEIEKIFGTDVAELVLAESEHKAKPWQKRKEEQLQSIKNERIEAKQICCADKLSNLMSIYFDLQTIGDEVWKKFKKDKTKVQWYFKSMIEQLDELEPFEMYQQLKHYYTLVFQNEDLKCC